LNNGEPWLPQRRDHAILTTARQPNCSPRKAGSVRSDGSVIVATAAEAIRLAEEDFPTIRTLGTRMQVGDERFDSEEIRRLYDSDECPLQRRAR